jgi:hypothetical protein
MTMLAKSLRIGKKQAGVFTPIRLLKCVQDLRLITIYSLKKANKHQKAQVLFLF